MFARDRIGDKNWDTYEEVISKGQCKCGRGKIEDVYFVASHEKVLRIERDFIERKIKCSNPNCPSKNED